jgi:hypothetical protein
MHEQVSLARLRLQAIQPYERDLTTVTPNPATGDVFVTDVRRSRGTA